MMDLIGSRSRDQHITTCIHVVVCMEDSGMHPYLVSCCYYAIESTTVHVSVIAFLCLPFFIIIIWRLKWFLK